MSRVIIILSLFFCCIHAFPQWGAWEEISDNIPSGLPDGDFTDIACLGDNTWITLQEFGGNTGIILYSDNGCENFTVQELQDIPRTIHMVNNELGYVGCTNGNVYYTTNGGDQWHKVQGSINKTIHGITAVEDPFIGFACGEEGWIAKFDTSQFLSLIQPLGGMFPPEFHDITFPTDTSEGWVVGGHNTIGYYNKGSWSELSVPQCDKYYGIYFHEESDLGWAVGGQGVFMTPEVIHTNDGLNWFLQSNPLIDQYLYDVQFVDQLSGWAVGYYIIGTYDGGISWGKEADDFPNIWNSVSSTENTVIFVVGNNKRILKKEDLFAVDSRFRKLPVSLCPNPFSSGTTLSYTLEEPENVQFTIYNVQYQIVYAKNVWQEKGEHQLRWNAEGIPAGMYFFRIQAGNKVAIDKMVKKD